MCGLLVRKNTSIEGERLGTLHLAIYDVSQKLKQEGLAPANKAILSVSEIRSIIETHYPDIKFKITSKNMVNVAQELGLNIRTKSKKLMEIDGNEWKRLIRFIKTSKHINCKKKIRSRGAIEDFLFGAYPELLKYYSPLKEEILPELNDLLYREYTNKPSCLPNVVKPLKHIRNSATNVQNVDVTTKEFLSTWEWKTLRYEVLVEQGAKCNCCGATAKDGVVMNVDHIKPRKTHPHLALTKSNLQVLCSDCNMGKGNWDDTSWV